MMHFKNHNGFTIVENLVSLAIIALVLTPIFVAQMTILRNVTHRSAQFDRIMQAKAFMIEVHRILPNETRQFIREKKITKPATQLKYELKELPSDSPLKKAVSNLLIEQVTLRWTEGVREYTDTLIHYIFKPKSAVT